MAFDVEFEREILAQAAVDVSYREKLKRVMGQHGMTDRYLDWVWGIIRDLPRSDRLTGVVVVALAKRAFKDPDKRDDHMTAAMTVLKLTPSAPGTALAQLSDYVSYMDMSAGMERAIKALDAGEVAKSRAILRKASKDESDVHYRFTDYIEDFEERQEKRKFLSENPHLRLCVPTKIALWDAYMDGGIEAGELGLIVGTTGRGKSHMACHLGFWGAATGFTVLDIRTEMSKLMTSTRYDSKLLGLPSNKIKGYDYSPADLRMIDAKISRIKARLAGKLRIVATPIRKAHINVIEQALDDMAAEGRPVQLLIVDCADHVKPIDTDREQRIRVANTFWDLKSLAEDREIAVWATAQASKEVVNRIATAENVADAYDKARIADIVFTLNQSKADERMGRMKGYLAKYRSGESKKIVPMIFDGARSHFELDEDALKGRASDEEEEDEDA